MYSDDEGLNVIDLVVVLYNLVVIKANSTIRDKHVNRAVYKCSE